MSAAGLPTLVLGIGNVLLRDEGVGVAVTSRLIEDAGRGRPLPQGTRIVDGGTLGLDLLPMLGEAGSVVIVDAVNLGEPPGSTRVLRGSEIEAALTGHVSPHQIGVGDLVAAARLLGTLPERVALVGIQPAEISIGLELTPSVAAAVGVAADLVRAELAQIDHAPAELAVA